MAEFEGEKKYRFKKPEEKETKKVLMLIGAFLIAAVIVGVIYFLSLKPQEIPPKNITPPITPNVTEVCDDECQMKKAMEEQDYTFCDEIENKEKKQQCYSKLALVSLEACIRLEDYDEKKKCVEWHALSEKSTAICNNLEVGDRKQCIEKVDPCFYKVLTEKALCFARLNKNYSYCEKDEECIYSYAELESDSKACNEINSTVKRQFCLSLVAGKDKCDELLLASQVDYCRQLYATRTGQSMICAKISPDTIYFYECYTNFSITEKNKDFCKHLSLNDRWNCYTAYAIGVGDVSGCNAIDKYASSSKVNCFITFSKTFHNPSICEYLEDPGHKINCYFVGIGIDAIYPVENCAGIKVTSWRNRCYTSLAQRTGNMTICDYILTEYEKKHCISTVTTS